MSKCVYCTKTRIERHDDRLLLICDNQKSKSYGNCVGMRKTKGDQDERKRIDKRNTSRD